MGDRKIFHGSIAALPIQEGLTASGARVSAATPAEQGETLDLHFALSLAPGAQEELDARVAKGEVIPLAELRQKYSASADDAKKLEAWLTAQGLTITRVAPDNSSVYARGTATQIGKALAVEMVRVTQNGVACTAARNAPSLPVEVAGSVQAIVGLQPFLRARKHGIAMAPRHGNRAAAFAKRPAHHKPPAAPPVPPELPSPAPEVKNAPPYLVSEILKAYGADNLGVTGKGETIAILIDTVPAKTDLTAFWKNNQLAVTLEQITFINVKGAALPPTEGEETLDVEWTSGIAPGASVRVYASGSLQFEDLNAALDQIYEDLGAQPTLHQLSISLGLGETFMAADIIAAQHQRYSKLAAAGVNVFVSSGDAGSNPDNTGQNPTGPTQTEYAASDTSVIAVGGTTLKLAADGSVASEIGWQDGGGGSSGLSFGRPVWQKGAGIAQGTSRLVPDVSASADPNDGAYLFYNGAPIQIGGTSWSAPMWAGFCALINEARANAGKEPLPFLNPLLYPLLGSAAFRDITAGSNGAYSAGPGYDLVTGLGVPDVKALIAALP